MLNQNIYNFSWHEEALCKSIPTEVFFPSNYTEASLEPAKRICSQCDVKAECLQDAISHNVYGIWAGTTEQQRRNIVNNYYNGEYQVVSLKEAKYILDSIIRF